MSETVSSIIYFIALSLGGYFSIDLIYKKNLSALIKIGLSFIIGCIIYVSTMLALFFLGFELSIIPYCFILILILGRWMAKRQHAFIKIDSKIGPVSIFLIILVITTLVFSLIETHMRPLVSWDGIASWFVGAKSIIVNRTISEEFYRLMEFDFPPATHFLIAYPGFFLGKYSETGGLVLFNFIHISTIILLFGMLREKMKLNTALFYTFLYASTQNIVRHSGYMDVGHVDIILSYFILCSVFLMEKLSKKIDYKSLCIVSFVLAIIALTKNEGLSYSFFGYLVVIYLTFKNSMKTMIYWLIPGFFILMIWYLYKILNLPDTSVYVFDRLPHFNQLTNIFFVIYKETLNVAKWNLGWIFIILTIPFWIKRRSLLPIIFIGLLQITVFIVAYLISFMDPVIHASSSFDRLILQLYPLFLYIAAVSFVRRNKSKNELQ